MRFSSAQAEDSFESSLDVGEHSPLVEYILPKESQLHVVVDAVVVIPNDGILYSEWLEGALS